MALLRWNPVSDRITSARVNSRFAKLTIIMLYVPTNEIEENVKDEFFEQVQREVERAPGHDVIIIMGYSNVKVGQDNLG